MPANKYPPRQKAASFTIDRFLEKLERQGEQPLYEKKAAFNWVASTTTVHQRIYRWRG